MISYSLIIEEIIQFQLIIINITLHYILKVGNVSPCSLALIAQLPGVMWHSEIVLIQRIVNNIMFIY